MTQATNVPLRVGAIGLDDRQRNALSMVFEGLCRKAYCLVETGVAEAWIVDLDHQGALDSLVTHWRVHGERPVLFLSLKAPDRIAIDGAAVPGVHLRKPFRIDAFVALLPAMVAAARRSLPIAVPIEVSAAAGRIALAHGCSRAARLLNDEATHQLVGTASDVDLNDAGQREQIYYAPERYLQGRVMSAWQRATAASQPLAMEGPWPKLVLFPAEKKVQIAAPARDYRAFAMVPNLRGEHRETLLHAERTSSGVCLPYSVFLWKLTLWAARGRLPAGTPLDMPVFLRWWPNFTRLDVSPSALAIAALWSRAPHSLAMTVQVLGVPQRWIFAFYSATHAIDLSGVSRSGVGRMVVPQASPTPGKPQSLLGRVLDKLRHPAG